MLKIALLTLVLFSVSVFAEDRLEFKKIITSVPETATSTLKTSFSKEALPYWGAILGSTAVLYQYDEQIYSDLQKRGRDWGVGNQDETKSILIVSDHEILRLPSDTGSFMYFLGDGWLHAGIGGAFLGAGSIRDDNRAFNTGIMIWHGMVVSTIFNQTLKRSFGRESPEVSTSERGSWNLFPNFNDYNTKTASYDAMPSGHVMTATLTFTIISERYPEYNSFIYPLYGVWASALMFQMVNNGVHWASDYPLGIAMGYVVGKMSTRLVTGKTENQSASSEWMIFPGLSGLHVSRTF